MQKSWSEKLAEQICIMAHKGQKRKQGGPYHEHPMAVRDLANKLNWQELWSPEEHEFLKQALLLHDVLEDTTFDESILKRALHPTAYYILDMLTRREDMTKDEYWKQILISEDICIIGKALDVLHNTSTLPVFDIAINDHLSPSNVRWCKKFVKEKQDIVRIMTARDLTTVSFVSGVKLCNLIDTQLQAAMTLAELRELHDESEKA